MSLFTVSNGHSRFAAYLRFQSVMRQYLAWADTFFVELGF